ncbi:MAG: phage baseplate assembly protein V [Planctomycetes bacterium]|nr:phage baseplate assembly protein V [Planctomycetota bacterium]
MEPITDIMGQGRDAQAQASKIYGVVIGIVTNNKDPDKLGRVKVKFPWLSDEVESFWARPAYPMNGKERGYWWIPEIDDEVLLAFEHGDPNRPYLLGGLYNGVDKPPKCHDITNTFAGEGYDHGAYSTSARDFNDDGNNDLRFIRSRSGHLFIFDDKANEEKITLCDKEGKRRIEIFTDKKKVVITSAGTDGDIELIAERKILLRCKQLYTESREETDMKAGKTFTVKSKGDMTHESKANMKREASSNIEEKAGSSITYKAGSSLEMKSGAGMDIKSGAAMSINAGATAEFKSSAPMTIKGATVAIN